jgi:SlyX protein
MAMTDSSLESLQARVYELETQMAFQEEMHARLDKTVAQQDGEVLLLKHQLKALAQRLEAIGESPMGGSGSLADEVPPHY